MFSFVCFSFMGGEPSGGRCAVNAVSEDGIAGREESGGVPSFEVLDARHPLLGVDDHFAEQVGEAGSAQLRRPAAVQVAVVDGLAVRGCSETAARRAALRGCLCLRLRLCLCL